MSDAIILLSPALLALFATLLVRVRGLSLRDDAGLRPFTARQFVIWGGGFLALAVVSELVSRSAGLGDPAGAWIGRYDMAALALRILAVALVYPLAEEYFFRGALIGALRARLGELPAIGLSSLLFAVVHIQYDWRGMSLVLIDALFFAVCRVRTGSLYLTMAFHVAGNGFAVWQRLHG